MSENHPLSLDGKLVVAAVAAVISALGLGITIHRFLLRPAMMHDIEQEVRQALRDFPAVAPAEYEQHLERFDQVRDYILTDIREVEARLRALEARK